MHLTVDAKVEVSNDGSSWVELPGVSSFSVRAGDPPTRTRVDFGGVHPLVGAQMVKMIDVSIPRLVVGSDAHITLTAALGSRGKIHVRCLFPERIKGSPSVGARVENIDVDSGLVTFSSFGTNVDFTRGDIEAGMAIKTDDGRYWVIRSIDGDGNVTVRTGGEIVSSIGYRVVVPPVRSGAFRCKVTSYNGFVGDSDSVLGTSLRFVILDEGDALSIGDFA